MTHFTLVVQLLLAALGAQDWPEPRRLLAYHPADEWVAGNFFADEPSELAASSLAIVQVWNDRLHCLLPDKARVRVQVRVQAGRTLEAEVVSILHCSAVQVRLPAKLPSGTHEITVLYDNAKLESGEVRIVRSYFGVLKPVGDAAGTRMKLTGAASGGSVISLFGTGLGDVSREEIRGELDGTPLALLDMEREDSGAGLDVLRFRLPAQLTVEGCYVPMAVRVAGKWSDILPVAVSPSGGACRHPLGLPPQQMEILDSGRSIGLASVQLTSTGQRGWSRYSAAMTLAGLDLVAEAAFERHAEGCRTLPPNRPRAYPVMLDGGTVSVRGPGGVLPPEDSVQGALPPGAYVVQTTGGLDVPPFSVQVRIPEPPRPAQRVRRLANDDLSIEWDGAKYEEGEVFTVSAFDGREPGFICKAPARAGIMTIPARAERIGRVAVAVERSKQHPQLFPLLMSNGARFQGIMDYSLSEDFSIFVQPGGQP
ncbi:MAG: hypothetical protein JNK48_34155 [Bryobacterales bacterium]|nr:hypothetical protein [Bryobacterales bacterium]